MHVNTLISSLRAYNVHTLTLHMVATPLTCDHTPHLVFLDKEAYALQVLPNVLCAQKSLHLFGPGELILR